MAILLHRKLEFMEKSGSHDIWELFFLSQGARPLGQAWVHLCKRKTYKRGNKQLQEKHFPLTQGSSPLIRGIFLGMVKLRAFTGVSQRLRMVHQPSTGNLGEAITNVLHSGQRTGLARGRCTHTHIHMHTHAYAYVYRYRYTYIKIHICAHTHAHVHTHACICVHTYIYIHLYNIHMPMHTIYIHVCIYTHLQESTCIPCTSTHTRLLRLARNYIRTSIETFRYIFFQFWKSDSVYMYL